MDKVVEIGCNVIVVGVIGVVGIAIVGHFATELGITDALIALGWIPDIFRR